MASLKEVKNRIASVQSTRKITSAMKMVASSKLHKAQQTIESMRPYERHLSAMMARFMHDMEGEADTTYTEVRSTKHVLLVAFSSNSSLCGGFNQNINRLLKHTIEAYSQKGVKVTVLPIGAKVTDFVRKSDYPILDMQSYSPLLDHPVYQDATTLAEILMKEFQEKRIDRIELVYNHFKSTSIQETKVETYLPVLPTEEPENKQDKKVGKNQDFIIEPSASAILQSLVPTSLHLKVYTTLLDSLAAEHSARVIAMQIATDNADELLRELTLTYNKTRQQAITNELLDLVGGSLQ